ncbi:MAG: 3'-5' exonuclease [Anaerolineae bacterium]|nr:3'-5' exonuclease [Anaerolineae bacterium]
MSRNREQATAWAQWALFQANLAILDTETTGLAGAEIVEIGVIDRGGQPLFHSLVQPFRYIPRDVFAIHGIMNADVANAPTFSQIYDELQRTLEGKYVVIYNESFDVARLHDSARAWNLPSLKLNSDCAMEAYAQWYGDWSEYHQSYRWQKLGAAAYRFGWDVDWDRQHNSLEDCLMTLHVLRGMAGYEPYRDWEWDGG